MEISIDVTELVGYADAMAQAPGVLQAEMKASSAVALHEGIGYAQENVPRKDGILAASIMILDGPTAEGGAYGSSLVYANQREYGGTIYPRNGKFLVFEVDGELVFARSVTQTGSFYMKKSMETLEPRIEPIYQLAVDRTLGVI